MTLKEFETTFFKEYTDANAFLIKYISLNLTDLSQQSVGLIHSSANKEAFRIIKWKT